MHTTKVGWRGGMDIRSRSITLIPPSSGLVRLECALHVAQLVLEQLAQILLVRCGPPEVALCTVLVDGEVETSCGIFGVILTVDLERIDVGVGGIIGVFQVVDLDLCSLLKCLPCLSVFCDGQLLSWFRSYLACPRNKTHCSFASCMRWRLDCRGPQHSDTCPPGHQRSRSRQMR